MMDRRAGLDDADQHLRPAEVDADRTTRLR
jgi:hypothetical protein